MYRLRELERRDLPTINRWRNQPELIRFLGAPFRYINHEVDEAWFDAYMRNRSSTVRCAITETGDDGIIGLISLTEIDHLNQCAVLHIMIGDATNQSRGIGNFAVNEMLNHAFFNLNLHRVGLEVLEDNERAIRLYEKCGFKCEGRRKQAVYKRGKFIDMLMYSCIREEKVVIGGGEPH